MHEAEIDQLLAASARRYESSVVTNAALDAIVVDTRRAASIGRPPRRRRLAWLVPGAVLAAGALTAGGVVVDDLLRAKLPIAVEYVTEAGVTVSCTAEIRGGSLFSPHRNEVVDYYQTRDFTGIGQRIHDYATVLTGDNQPAPGVLPKSSQVVPQHGQYYADAEAFSFSLTSFLLTDAMVDLGIAGSGDAALTSDCTGRLR